MKLRRRHNYKYNQLRFDKIINTYEDKVKKIIIHIGLLVTRRAIILLMLGICDKEGNNIIFTRDL